MALDGNLKTIGQILWPIWREHRCTWRRSQTSRHVMTAWFRRESCLVLPVQKLVAGGPVFRLRRLQHRHIARPDQAQRRDVLRERCMHDAQPLERGVDVRIVGQHPGQPCREMEPVVRFDIHASGFKQQGDRFCGENRLLEHPVVVPPLLGGELVLPFAEEALAYFGVLPCVLCDDEIFFCLLVDCA